MQKTKSEILFERRLISNLHVIASFNNQIKENDKETLRLRPALDMR